MEVFRNCYLMAPCVVGKPWNTESNCEKISCSTLMKLCLLGYKNAKAFSQLHNLALLLHRTASLIYTENEI